MTKDEAIEWAGTQVKLAEKLGLRSQGTIAGWGEFPPELRQLQIEALSGGLLKAEPGCDKFRIPMADQAAEQGAA